MQKPLFALLFLVGLAIEFSAAGETYAEADGLIPLDDSQAAKFSSLMDKRVPHPLWRQSGRIQHYQSNGEMGIQNYRAAAGGRGPKLASYAAYGFPSRPAYVSFGRISRPQFQMEPVMEK